MIRLVFTSIGFTVFVLALLGTVGIGDFALYYGPDRGAAWWCEK